jgi:hypothetical protein
VSCSQKTALARAMGVTPRVWLLFIPVGASSRLDAVRFDETTQATKAVIYSRVKGNLDAMFGPRGLLLAGENAGENGDAALFSEERRVRVIGTRSGSRQWDLYFATLPAFERGAKSILPAFVLMSGLSVSVLLFAITWMLARSRTQALSSR